MKKLAKLLLSGIIAGSMMLSSIGVFANTNQVVKVKIGSNVANVNGQNVTMDAVPYIQEYTNVTMIPLRFVSTAFGIPDSDITYDVGEKRIVIKTNKMFNEIDEITYFLNYNIGNYGYPELKNGRTYIPLRALCNSLSLVVEWDNATKTATMTSNVSLANNSSNNTNQNTNNTVINNTQNNNSSLVNNSTNQSVTNRQDVRAMEEEVVRLVNEERAKYGLQPLEISEKLMETARMKSDDMAKNNYFGHTNPNGYTLYQQIEGLNNFWTIMENIAGGKYPDTAMNLWLTSDAHREQILNPNYKYIGVGFSNGYWTQHFSSNKKWEN